MATTKIAEELPTIEAVALDLTENANLGKVSRDDVIAAAKRGHVALKEGRVMHRDLGTIYFNLRDLREES